MKKYIYIYRKCIYIIKPNKRKYVYRKKNEKLYLKVLIK